MSRPRDPSPPLPLFVHIVHRFDVGGMENGLVNLVNRLPESLGQHCVVALTEAESSFVARIRRPDTRVIALHKPPGQLLPFLPAVYRLLRSLRPQVVHTRNVGTLETQLAAFAAGVPVRIHGEHGWDVGDLAGENRRMLWLRRLMRHFVHHQVALSAPTQRYLLEQVQVPRAQVTNICNGVDIERFAPPADRASARRALAATDPRGRTVLEPDAFVVGAVGRLAAVKNPGLLVEAFAAARIRNAAFAERARLVLVGDGPLEAETRAQVTRLGLAEVTWMPGARSDVPQCLQALDLLCLPSLAEGISNAILEAMACGLPVLATDVGGNRELVSQDETGWLLPSGDREALAQLLLRCFEDPARTRAAGAAARARAVTQFSLQTMVDQYHKVYAAQLARAGIVAPASAMPPRAAPNP